MMNRLLFCILLIAASYPLRGQQSSTNDLIDCVEKQYGADNLLVNGRPYYPSHTRAEGHPYFETSSWTNGKVFIKGHEFEVNNLKYNILTQQLILNHIQKNGLGQSIILSHALVDSFHLGAAEFINVKFISSALLNTNYLERIYSGRSSFFRIQRKVFGSISNFRPYGQFSNLKDEFVLIKDDTPFLISKRKNFLSIFPDRKKEIKRFMKQKDMKWGKMDKAQFSQLLKFCDDQI